jgi:hypothetical protein
MNKNAPLISRGVGGLPGLADPNYAFDMSAAASFQFPVDEWDFVGPAINTLGDLYRQVISPSIEYGVFKSDYMQATQAAPIAKHYLNILDYATKNGWLKDKNGNNLYQVPDALPFILQSIAGVESVDLNRIRAEERILSRREERINQLKTRLINEGMQAILSGQPLPDRVTEELAKGTITIDSLINRVESSQLDPDLRRILRTEIRRRPDIVEMYPNRSDYGNLP